MNRKPELLFEKFEIETVIKKDEYSAVYLANHVFLGKRIFLKTLSTGGLSDPTLLQRFKREAKILARLDHPHIIKVLDFGTFGDRFYISFEYFESENLRHWLQKRSLKTAQKEFLLAQLAQALQFAHERGVVHRDLKPENILINADLQLKIADFGLALWNDESNITEATSIVGTPAYMSPEQIRGEKLSHKTDLFNLGIIVYEMFLGKNPFLGSDAGQTINNILNFDETELRHSYERLPENIVRILDGLLRKNPDERFTFAKEILSYLPFKEELPSAPFTDHRRSIFKAIVLIAVPLFLLLILVIVLKRPQKTEPKPTSLKAERESAKTIEEEAKAANPAPGIQTKKTQAPNPKKKPKQNKIGKVGAENVAKPIAAKKEAKAVPGKGRLWIECLPWANVTIDSQQTVTTPLKSPLVLQEGWHRLTFKHPAFPVFKTKIRIRPDAQTVFKVKLDTLFGFVDCQVFPWGKIYLDGRFIDDSPLKKPIPATAGSHILRVENPQFQTYEKRFVLKRGDTLRVKVNFLEQKK